MICNGLHPHHEIAPLLIRPVGRPPKRPVILYDDFWYRAGSWDRARRVVAKVEWHRGELFPRVGFIVTNMTAGPEGVVRFYNGRGTAEQWIKERKYALNWTRLSCHRFVANRVRLSLFILAYNLGNFRTKESVTGPPSAGLPDRRHRGAGHGVSGHPSKARRSGVEVRGLPGHHASHEVAVAPVNAAERPQGGHLVKGQHRARRDQEWAGRLVRHTRVAAIDLSVVRGVGSSTVVRASVGSYRTVIACTKLREGTNQPVAPDDLAKREGAPGSRLVFNALSPHWRGPEDDKDGQEAWFTARNASLIG